MNHRIRSIIILALASVMALSVSSCGRREVKVKTGIRLVCKYGHVLKDTTRFVTVPADKAGSYHVTEQETICERHRRAQELYAQAQKALAARDKVRAKRLLAQVVALDPTFEKAASQYKSVGGKITKASSTKSSASGSGSRSGGSGGGGSGTPSSALYLSRIPRSFSSYTLVSQNEDAISGTRLFAGRSSSSVKLLTVSVRWLGKKADFYSWYSNTLAPKYSVGRPSPPTVNGRKIYIGTDGSVFAHACWNENGLVFQAQMEARKGSPTLLLPQLLSVVRIVTGQ